MPFGEAPMHPTCADESICCAVRNCQLRTRTHNVLAGSSYGFLPYHGRSESCPGARKQLLGKPCFRKRNDRTAADWDEPGRGLSTFQILEQPARYSELGVDGLQEHPREWPLHRESELHAVAARREGCEDQVITASYLRISSGINRQASSQFEGSVARPAFTRSYRCGTSFS